MERQRQRQTEGEARALGSRHRGRTALPCPGRWQRAAHKTALQTGRLDSFQLGKRLLSSWSNRGCHRVPQTQRFGWGLLPGSLISIPGGLIRDL